MYLRYLLVLLFLCCCLTTYGQQDIDFHLNATLLPGKNILKVKRDFNDPYLWVLAQGNQVYRINSITNSVDDYTAQFAVYSGLQFVDIAGRSQDTVFIATNSTNVLKYEKGAIKTLGSADGITGTVNSIGIDNSFAFSTYFGGALDNLIPSARILLIATSTGLVRYDYQTGTIYPPAKAKLSRIFEMSYRNEMFHGTDFCRCYADTVDKYDVTSLMGFTIFGGEVWTGGNSFGQTVKSAYFTKGSIFEDEYYSFMGNQFWSTETGLFQNNWNQSYNPAIGYRHYLNGVQINKITSIYGLESFAEVGRYGGAKENLLIGSDQGLYVSNSMYQSANRPYDFYHYDGLGTKKINDICVNANTYLVRSPTVGVVCEDGAWIAATDGLYLLKPDYAPYIKTTDLLQAIQFEGQAYNLSELQVCTDAGAKAVMQGYRGKTIQWYKNGLEIPNESGTSLTITQPGEYNAIVYDPCSVIHFETNHLKITKIASPVFAFNYPDNIKYCAGSSASLQTDNNAIYQYRWYKDGVLNGNTTATLNNITQPGKYKVEVSACSGSWVPSKEVQIDFIKVPPPVITTDKAAYCNGDQAILTAAVPIDATEIVNWQPYQYRWFKDGVLLTGNTTATLNVNQPGKYKAEATSCFGNSATSAEVQVNFITLATPVITANKPAYCIGDIATLTTPFVNDGTYTINWLRNGTAIPAAKNNTSFNTNVTGTYTISISSNLTSCSQSSAGYALSFVPMPTFSLERIVNTTLCDGQTVDLKASYSAGTVKWSTGETADKISIKQSGTYTATVKTIAGCEVSKDIAVQFLANPTLSVPDATLCQFTNDQLTLTAPPGFVSYQWNGQTGGQTYTANTLGQVTLIVTDLNGCKATQTINITSHCKDIHIPNTFTPNGDGINDKWVIAGLEGDQTVNVKVYGRTGDLVFQSQGYSIPWDGLYKGKKVPAGVYYYVITAKGSNQVLSGSITIIY